MSEGLKELKEIELKWQYGVFTFIPNFEIIEKELKDYQEINIKYKLAIEIIDNIADEFSEHDLDELADKIVKVKKALEIIKKYILDDKDYLDLIARNINIPKKELDFIKEVLYESNNDKH